MSLSLLVTLVTVTIVAVLVNHLLRKIAAYKAASSSTTYSLSFVTTSLAEKEAAKPSSTIEPISHEESDQLNMYRELYFKVQNLEEHPEILPRSRELLLAFLSQAVQSQPALDGGRSILDVEQYSPQALEAFMRAEHEHILGQYEHYLERTTPKKVTELFKTRHEAGQWLKRIAPMKFVDGAWLGHIHRITTPFALRDVTKNAWQVLSEELGDGNFNENHVFLYQEVLRQTGCSLPDGDTIEFIQPQHGMDDVHVWKAAVVQLLISLFPNDFLPEILGFNLHYEQLSMETLKASRELPLFGISAYYFFLHISVDNADSGHTAMASNTVMRYMSLIQDTQGEKAAQEVWERIKAGYVLSKTFDGTKKTTIAERSTGSCRRPTVQEVTVMGIFRQKAMVSQKLHCKSRVKIGHRNLEEWLQACWADGEAWHLLDSLADSTPWVYKGNSDKSLLVRYLKTGGKMNGAFTHTEVQEIRAWINNLETSELGAPHRYLESVRKDNDLSPKAQDLAVDHPVIPPYAQFSEVPMEAGPFAPRQPLKLTSIQPSSILPLWFGHLSLLENFVSIPIRTKTPLNSHVVRLLRAEYGFSPETEGVAGMDEYSLSTYHPSLVDLGIEIARHNRLPEPTCLKGVLEDQSNGGEYTTAFSYSMLGWSMWPKRNESILLGLARAFLDFEVWVADTEGYLAGKDKFALQQIVKRKERCFELCLQELTDDKVQYQQFIQGYEIGRSEIEQLLEPASS